MSSQNNAIIHSIYTSRSAACIQLYYNKHWPLFQTDNL